MVLVDRSAEQLDKAAAGMRASLAKLAGKGALGGQEPEGVMARLRPATDLQALSAADLVVEAVPEAELADLHPHDALMVPGGVSMAVEDWCSELGLDHVEGAATTAMLQSAMLDRAVSGSAVLMRVMVASPG